MLERGMTVTFSETNSLMSDVSNYFLFAQENCICRTDYNILMIIKAI